MFELTRSMKLLQRENSDPNVLTQLAKSKLSYEGLSLQIFTCSKSTMETLEKPFSIVSFVDFEQVNVSWVHEPS